MPKQELPLTGVRVIDLSVVLAGPISTMMLGDLGAEVIRVESINFFPGQTRGRIARPKREELQGIAAIGGGYPDREPGERPWNRFPWFNASNRNKRGITMDTLQPEGVELFNKLVEMADVIVNNQTLRASRRLGFDYETVSKINPRLIYVHGSLFGNYGPIVDWKGTGTQMEAFSGHDSLRHFPYQDPSSNDWMVPSDAAGGVGIALATILGLMNRDATGEGQLIDISMIENEIALLGPLVTEAAITGVASPPRGNGNPFAVQGCYRSPGEENWLTLTVINHDSWRGLAKLLGRDDWTDATYDEALASQQRQDEVDEVIATWVAGRDRDEAVAQLLGAGVWAGPVLPDNEIVDDEQLVARNHFLVMDHADAGRHRYPGPPYRLRDTVAFPQVPPVRLGEHNDEVYTELLGLSPEEIDKLRAIGQIGEEYAANIP